MMKEFVRHLIAFIVKLGSTIVALYVVATFYPLYGHMHFLHAVILGLIIAVVGYIADLIIPRALNYIVAVFADFGLATLVVYMGNVLLGMEVSWTFAIMCGLLIAGVEFFYHFQFVRKTNDPLKGEKGRNR